MFKKTKVRQILELLHKDLSAREISKTLDISRNSVAFVKVHSKLKKAGVIEMLLCHIRKWL